MRLTVLVDEHPYGDATHVEPVKEVLDLLVHAQCIHSFLTALPHLNYP